MKNILLTIEYDGSEFHGWQRQPEERTVQGTLEEALEKLLGEEVSVNGTSRTDAGVHALGQCCSFSGDFGIPTENIKGALNNLLSDGKTISGSLPGAIIVLDCKEVPEGFHARFNCTKKTYIYKISTGEANAFDRKYKYFVPGKLDIKAMGKAAGYIVGTHDFACFQSAGGTPRETTVRTVFDLKIDIEKEDVNIEITGDGFLYNMVRIIVGTLVEVGQGRRSPESVKEAIEAMDRSLAGHTAPAEGLYLSGIYFE